MKQLWEYYAMTQNNLGAAYQTLAEVREKEENTERAIRAYEAALEIYTVEKYPIYYAKIQNNLEITYGILAENKKRS
jgi:tetratricopeptide (TPR) repeat protein